MFFVEPDDKTKQVRRVVIKITEDQLEFMQNLIATVYGKIKNHEFSKGCGRKECEWCRFNELYLKKGSYRSEALISTDSEADAYDS